MTAQQTADQMLILDQQRRKAMKRGQPMIASVYSKDIARLAINLFTAP